MKQLILTLLVFFSLVSAVSAQSHVTIKEKQQAALDSSWKVDRAFYLAGKLDSLPAIKSKMLHLAQKIGVDSSFAKIEQLEGGK